jgi:putative Mg2+ transporter-C (MgtC) family protein
VPSEAELALRIFVAAGLGGLIGLEREVTDQPAGLRTHIGVALGSALFGIVSAYAFDEFVQPRANSNYQVDVTRVASTVVTGVGFLGGGAILKHGASVRGLTTAASLWVTSAIGLASGLGVYFVAVVTTVAMLLSLVGLRPPRRWLRDRLSRRGETVQLTLAPGARPAEVVAALHDLPDVRVRSLSIKEQDEATVVQADVVGEAGVDLEARLIPLAQREDIEEVDVS